MTNDFDQASKLICEFHRKLEVVVKRDSSRHMMDAHMPISLLMLLEDEMLPLLQAAIDDIEYDPTPQYAEEPGITMVEMHSGAWVQHQAMHS
jgi:hypothetical protein